MKVDLLVNPFCMAQRDVDSIRNICDKHGVALNLYNFWDIEDVHLYKLPQYIALLVQEWRSGKKPGRVYSIVFVDGERSPLNDWPKHLTTLEQKITLSPEEGAK